MLENDQIAHREYGNICLEALGDRCAFKGVKLHHRGRSQPISQQQPLAVRISMRTSMHSVVRSPEGELME